MAEAVNRTTLTWKPEISEAEYEQFLDRAVQRRLATDNAYRFAESSQQQSEREYQVEREEDERLAQKYRIK